MTRDTLVRGERSPVCYLAPWVDYGGSDKGTIDWFRWIDRDRFAPVLVTTQPSDNRRLSEIYPYAEEVWPLPEFLAGQHFPSLILDLVHTRGVEVLHIMNSRIGYDLLPDLASLSDAPAVVVQLHVEEPDKSGYVRYVTTRYGNLVDAFSVSSEHLARAVEGYDVNPDKIHVIPTGVDAEEEFNPARVIPTELVEPGHFNIIFPGRLTAQKAPLLMVEVIRKLVECGHDVIVNLVGDGDLEDDVRAYVRAHQLQGHFRFHQPTRQLAPWYAACDLLLMTSAFEGVPYVVYEAMAMELPIVAPALPGNVELMSDTAGVLVPTGSDAGRYAEAVASMIEDRARSRALAALARARVRDGLTVQAMGARHTELYSELLERRGVRTLRASGQRREDPDSGSEEPPSARPDDGRADPVRFSSRPSRGQPLVSVVVPCFNHGRFLAACLDSICSQDYEALEVTVVDDASTDAATIRVLQDAAARDGVTVIRQHTNSGPSAARNRAIAQASGRYVLPVDADNILFPGALRSLVEQLQGAGELVGYIYPNCQYFGTRDDYFQPPSFNLDLLIRGNYCDTCSLIDREVFDAGFTYPDEMKLGHEDWDFVLDLARHGIRGEPAKQPTLLYRKHGFTRSDAVEYAGASFHEEIATRHPDLYGDDASSGRFGRWRGPAAHIKAVWSPGLSIVSTVGIDFSSEHGRRVAERLESQSCRDLELIVECAGKPGGQPGDSVRRIPPGLCAGDHDRLREGLRLVRAAHVLMVGAELFGLLGEQGFLEKLMRTFRALPKLEAIAFTDAGMNGRFPYRLLQDSDVGGVAHALAWRVEAESKLPPSLLLAGAPAPEALARAMSVKGVELQWRHAPALPGHATGDPDGAGWITLAERECDGDLHRRAERERVESLPPVLPAAEYDVVRRWLLGVTWIPPETDVLTRHREQGGEGRIIKLGRRSPPGYVLEYDLGAIQRFAPPGTVRLVEHEGSVATEERGSPRADGDMEFGHLELAHLPLLQPVERAQLPDGTETLVAGERDRLRPAATRLELLGYIEAFPNLPTNPPDAGRSRHGVVGLLRCIDWRARRHVYRVGSPGDDALVGELGALHLTVEPESIALFIDDLGRVSTAAHTQESCTPDTGEVMRWAVAPLAWRGFGHVRGRVRSAGRRGMETTARLRAGSHRRAGSPPGGSGRRTLAGYLYAEPAPGRIELLAAVHPITGDQLLTHHALVAADMGYSPAVSLGFALERAVETGDLEMARVSIPWASRFGLEVRRA